MSEQTRPSTRCLGNHFNRFLRSQCNRDFPGSAVVKILPFQYRGVGLISDQGTEIPYSVQCSQNKKVSPLRYVNFFFLSI